jgi:hypothetical protein
MKKVLSTIALLIIVNIIYLKFSQTINQNKSVFMLEEVIKIPIDLFIPEKEKFTIYSGSLESLVDRKFI